MVAIWYVQFDWVGFGDYKENKESEQSSPFRRWTTGSGAGNSYRQTEHRNHLYSKQQMSEGSAPEASSSPGSVARGQWANGGVARWSLGLEQLLADPVGRAAFAEFLAREYALENIKFWCSCEEYNQQQDPEQRAKLAKSIWERHLADDAPDPVNVDAGARRAAMARRAEDPLPPDLFHQAQRQIFHVMRMDSYQRFLRSGEHAECARADLRGQPPPASFALAAAAGRPASPAPTPAPSGSSTPSNDKHLRSNIGTIPSTPSKIQKSVSNVSDRRRSGGQSLLPWRLRVPSRERVGAPVGDVAPHIHPSPQQSQEHSATAAGTTQAAHVRDPITTPVPAFNTTIVAGAQLTDVVKSGPLCRVVLPDGATSVVGVEPGLPVRRLVDRLLQRRNLLAYNYDVLYRDVPEGCSANVDGSAPSSVLGGREVVVERRCVVRMEVCGRVVAVRCRPARRLRHVLRPVLARYSPRAAACPLAAPQVLRDGLPLHPDTTMLELDGARLQIVDVDEYDPAVQAQPSALGERACEGDSYPDLALRQEETGSHHDYELSSVSAPQACCGDHGNSEGKSGAAGVAAKGADIVGSAGACAAEGVSGVSAPAAGGASAVSGAPHGPRARLPATASGRVRAALKPGPPLHNHPPNFLENLRETQRQRLQAKNEALTPRAPAPPPLPPKPSSRTPTLV